jgi:putative aldouronate transport system permease protein
VPARAKYIHTEGNNVKETTGEKVILACNNVLLVIIAVIVLYPVFYILSASVSSGDALTTGKVLLWPVNFTTASYKYILSDPNIWTGYANTVLYTLAGTAVNFVFTICGAYPLSKKRLMWGDTVTKFVVFTMWFNPGMIPFYLTLKNYGLLDTRFAIIFAFALNTFNVIILRNFFSAVPHEIEEAAIVDGANDFQILIKFFLPLSLPALATVGLFYAVSRWNGYFWAMIIFKSNDKMPLQVFLKKMIVDAATITEYSTMSANVEYSKETIIYSTIMVSVLPMLAVYPFIQKYFVKGVTIGSGKG